MRLHRWFEGYIQWPLLDARDWILRRDRSKPMYGTPRFGTLRAKVLDSLPERTPPLRALGWVSEHRGGLLAFMALPLAAAAVIGVIATGSGSNGSVPSSSALAKAPVAQVQVEGVEANSAAEQAKRRERAAKRRELAAARRQRAADRRAAARRAAAADRKRARARARRAAKSTPAAAPSTPAATPVSTPSQPPAAPTPPRPSTPSRPPSRPPASNGGGGSSPSPSVPFDSTG
jgi:hypothetical protein